MRKKAAKPERKAALLEDINTIKESIEQKRNDFDNQIEEMILKIEEIENEISGLKDEKQIITDHILDKERTKQALISRNKIEKIARDSLKMISSLNK